MLWVKAPVVLMVVRTAAMSVCRGTDSLFSIFLLLIFLLQSLDGLPTPVGEVSARIRIPPSPPELPHIALQRRVLLHTVGEVSRSATVLKEPCYRISPP